MGGDGGVIATKRAFARGVGKTDESKRDGKNIHEEQATRATTCALTNEPLQAPLVACELGNIFNKEALLTALINRGLPDSLSHIRGLKDIKNLEFSTSTTENGSVIRLCPVTHDEFNGSYPFVVLWTTGKVLSEKAIREIGIDGLQEEYGPFAASDIVKLIPLEQDLDAARAAMHRRREAKKAAKKNKTTAAAESQNGDEEETAKKVSKKRSIADAGETDEAARGEQESAATSAAAAAAAPAALSSTQSLVKKARGSVEQNNQHSQVYKSLFHKDGEKDKKDRDLFMTVAGLRYTIN